MHSRPSLTPADRRENPQAKALHAGAASPCDVRIDVLKDSEPLESGGKRDPQSTFDGAGWVLVRYQSQCEMRGELPSALTPYPRPQLGTEETA